MWAGDGLSYIQTTRHSFTLTRFNGYHYSMSQWCVPYSCHHKDVVAVDVSMFLDVFRREKKNSFQGPPQKTKSQWSGLKPLTSSLDTEGHTGRKVGTTDDGPEPQVLSWRRDQKAWSPFQLPGRPHLRRNNWKDMSRWHHQGHFWGRWELNVETCQG